MKSHSNTAKPMNIIPKPTTVTNPDTIPVSTTGLIWIDENRWLAAAYLANFSEFSKMKAAPPRRSVLIRNLAHIEYELSTNVRGLSVDDARKILGGAFAKTRRRAKAITAKHGDLFNFPNEFVDVYADIVVEQIDIASEKISSMKELAA